VGDIGLKQTLKITQEFVVNGKTDSGIYSLPISIGYVRSDGTAVQDTLRASLIVIAPPRLQFQAQAPIPPQVELGNPITVGLSVTNIGEKRAILTRARILAENGTVIDGEEQQLSPLNANEDTSITANVQANGPGKVDIIVEVYYRDDFNREQVIKNTFSTEATEPPPLPTFDSTPPPTPTATPPSQDDVVRRIILGLLGLGR
jgi:hypothetical protein